MAKFEFRLPDIGEGVTEGEIVTWLVKAGDVVTEDQEMVEVMTDKATVTIGSPKAGKITELRGNEGDVVPVGDVLVVYELDGGASDSASDSASTDAAPAAPAKAPAAPAAKEAGPAATAVGDIKETLPGMSVAASAAPEPAAPAAAPAAGADAYFNEKPLAAPATRKFAREVGVDLRNVAPSGPAGRVTREDVETFRAGGGAPAAAGKAASSAGAPAPVPVRPAPPPSAVVGEERQKIRGMRKRIYENMARSKHTAAHFTYVDECETSALKAVRARIKPLGAAEGVSVSFLPFIVKAVVAALKRHPNLNCLVDDSSMEMVLRKNFDIGIAAATESGLTVPVLRDADRLSILEIARELERLGAAARDGKLGQADLGGSSFTITSLGKQGGLFATPIVNYPEVAILGIHEMKKRPIVKDDEIVIGEVMLLSLSFDHRIIDGHVGAAFAQEIIRLLENPDALMLEMS
jgi:pyruvate dehydrogenase E2 component (dihydrolipoamide acetyltransferase)